MSIERTIMDKFLEFLRYFFTKDLPDNAPPELIKERLYMVKFVFEQFKRSYIHYYEDRVVPIYEFTMYGEPSGRCIYEYVKSGDQDTTRNYNLNEFTIELKKIIEEWDNSLDKIYDEGEEETDYSILKQWEQIKKTIH